MVIHGSGLLGHCPEKAALSVCSPGARTIVIDAPGIGAEPISVPLSRNCTEPGPGQKTLAVNVVSVPACTGEAGVTFSEIEGGPTSAINGSGVGLGEGVGVVVGVGVAL